MKYLNIIFLCIFTLFSTPALTKRGCCSWHGGVSHCDSQFNTLRCRDGTLSPSCVCNYPKSTMGSLNTPSTSNNNLMNPLFKDIKKIEKSCNCTCKTQPEIEIIDLLKNLAIPKEANFKLHSPLSISEAFEGCLFEPFEYPLCQNDSCKKLQFEDPIFNEPFHYQTKCILKHKKNYLVSKNLQRDYNLHITMHGPRCCIHILQIEPHFPNHLTEILKDNRLKWIPLRCRMKEDISFWERWYTISLPNMNNLYAKLSSTSGSGGTWETLTIYWDIPKDLPPLGYEWANTCEVKE